MVEDDTRKNWNECFKDLNNVDTEKLIIGNVSFWWC